MKKEYREIKMIKKEAFDIASKIANKYGLTLNESDFNYNKEDSTWSITPYEGASGFKCRDGLWWGVDIDSYNIRFMEDDFDMFDEITDALDGIYGED